MSKKEIYLLNLRINYILSMSIITFGLLILLHSVFSSILVFS